ncbi:MAG: hypothetical protein HZC55_16670 [Verrucomicrobia bacterium]|nr:hypothetical protein [Verrucomicrobiota bacterium]
MNRITLALFAIAAVAARPLSAETRVSFGVSFGHPPHLPPPVVVAPPTVTVVAPHPASGYWREVLVKTWVPERWTYSRDRWGRTIRVREPGYFTYRTDRVWVETGPTCAPAPYPHHRRPGHRGW